MTRTPTINMYFILIDQIGLQIVLSYYSHFVNSFYTNGDIVLFYFRSEAKVHFCVDNKKKFPHQVSSFTHIKCQHICLCMWRIVLRNMLMTWCNVKTWPDAVVIIYKPQGCIFWHALLQLLAVLRRASDRRKQRNAKSRKILYLPIIFCCLIKILLFFLLVHPMTFKWHSV